VHESIEQVRERYAAFGQGHVFRFWDSLGEPSRRALAVQLQRIDPAALRRIHDHTRQLAAPGGRKLAPAPIEALPSHGGSAERRAAARERGEKLLRGARVAVMVVAGGQGTRLGFDGPKGLFPLGPVSDRTLFQLHAEKIRGARRRYGAPIPWYVMTSPATDASTRSCFAQHASFGLPSDDVRFLCQSMVPALDFDGRLILEAPDRIAESPNGHGGAFQALADSGALDDMAGRGITTISYFQVDNPLIRLADPVFLGLHDLEGAEMSCKVVRKVDPLEKVGVVARVDDRIGIVEYTEIDDAHRNQRGADGELVYWAGSIAIHAIETEFARRVAAQADALLPFHASIKKIPCLDASGRTASPERPNGHKLERFLFDALPAAERVAVLEVDRREEYAPVKNAEGADSPASARAALDAQVRRWLEGAGIPVPADARLEVDHSRIDGEEDVRESGIQSASDPAIRVAARGV